MLPNVSIIIPVYNAEKTLGLCLDSILKLDYPNDKLEVIIIDNISTDNSLKIIQKYPFKYYFEEKKTSYAARNKGIKIAKGGIIAFTDADCIVDKNWIKTGIYELYNDNSDIVGGNVLGYQPSTITEKYLDYKGSLNTSKSNEDHYFPTCNLFVKKDIFKNVGTFNDSFVTGGDLDFCWRCFVKGYKLTYSKDSIVYHKHRTNILDLYGQYFKYGFSKYFIKEKYIHFKESNFRYYFTRNRKLALWKDICISTILLPLKIIKKKGIQKSYLFFDLIIKYAMITGELFAILKNRNKPKIFFSPDWSQYNPYQHLLYHNLIENGFACYGIAFGYKWILSYLFCNKIILHLHWITGLCKLNSKHFIVIILSGINLIIKLFLSKIIGYKIIFTLHNFSSHENNYPKTESILTKFLVRVSDALIVHSSVGKDYLIEKYNANKKKLYCLPHGSYLGYYPNEVNKAEARNKLDINPNDIVLLFFGQVREYKGILDLIQSFSGLNCQNVKLIIAGMPSNNDIKKLIITNVNNVQNCSCFLEFIPENEVQLFFNASDIVVLPYKKILTSGSALLALSFGNYILAPASGNILDIMDERIGYFYKHNSNIKTLDVEKAIKNYKRNYDEKIAIEIADKLSWANIIPQYCELYKNLFIPNQA